MQTVGEAVASDVSELMVCWAMRVRVCVSYGEGIRPDG
jgi:hypothetical protein